MPETDDLYEILHLHPSAHPDVIQAAYRRLALLYHPDKNPSPEATEMMAAVNHAYAVLSDPEKRAEYDRTRSAQAGSAGTGPSAASSAQGSRQRSNAPRNPTGYFTLGSTKSEVADIHGPPHDVSIDRSIKEEVWHYGSDDSIEFDLETGRVLGWSNIRGNLRIRLVPGPNVSSYDFFAAGDHRDEVARLQGTPPVIIAAQESDREIWMYSRNNHVEFSFSTGSVIDWENGDGVLKARRQNPSTSASTSGRRASTSSRSHWRTLSSEYNDVGIYTVDPIDSDYLLIIRFRNRELEFYVVWGTKVSYSGNTTVNYQIDNGPAWRQSWNTSTDREATAIPAHDIAETIRALFDAREFTIQVYPFGGNPLTASFRVSGFRAAVRPVLDAWQRAGSPVPGAAAQGGGCFLLPAAVIGVAAVTAPSIWFFL